MTEPGITLISPIVKYVVSPAEKNEPDVQIKVILTKEKSVYSRHRYRIL